MSLYIRQEHRERNPSLSVFYLCDLLIIWTLSLYQAAGCGANINRHF